MFQNLMIIVLVATLSGCKPPHHGSSPRGPSSLNFGDGDAILKTILDPVLVGRTTKFSDMTWSGGGGNEEFAVDDNLIVKNATIAEISGNLSTELNKLPKARGWESHGSGAQVGIDYAHLELRYKEDGAQFYFDLILMQRAEDVHLLILHKGVKP